MQTEKMASKYLPTKAMLMIRILVGGYLLYTSYTLLEGLKVTEGAEQILLWVALLAFCIIGTCFILYSLKSMKMGKYKGGQMDAGEEAASEDREAAATEAVDMETTAIETAAMETPAAEDYAAAEKSGILSEDGGEIAETVEVAEKLSDNNAE